MKKFDKSAILKTILVSLSITLIVITNIITKNNDNKTIKVDDSYDWSIQEKTDKVLNIYLNNETYMVVNDESSVSSDYKKVGTYYCTNNECEIIGYKNYYSVIKDNKYYLYDVKTNKKKLLKLKTIKDIDLFFDNDKIKGLFVKDDFDNYAFYSIEKNSLLSAFTYNSIKETGVNNYILASIENNEYLIDYNSFNIKITAEDSNIKAYKTNNNLYYIVTNDNGSNIYNEKFEILFDSEFLKEFGISSNGNIALRKDNNSYSIYNNVGLLIKSSKNYKSVNKIMDNYILVVDNDDVLKLVDYDGNVINNLLNVNDKIIINWADSGYSINELNILNIYYVDKSDDDNIKNMHIIFDVKTSKKEVKEVIEKDNK